MAVINPERTIAEAALEVLRTEGKPLTSSQVYDAIVQNGLYVFHTGNPQYVVANQLRRHSRGYEKAASAVKYFVLLDDGKFALLPEEEQGRVRPQQARSRRTNSANRVAGFTSPSQISSAQRLNGLTAARERWPEHRERLLRAEGGVVSAEQAAHLLKTTPAAIEQMRQESAVLGLHSDRDSFVYPIWQFDHGMPLRGLSAVLQSLQGIGPWMHAAFMLTGDDHLCGERPLDVLRRGDVEAVVMAAREYGEQGGG